jgi:hypothetical protein
MPGVVEHRAHSQRRARGTHEGHDDGLMSALDQTAASVSGPVASIGSNGPEMRRRRVAPTQRAVRPRVDLNRYRWALSRRLARKVDAR